jgi:hypothetical protein
LNARPRLPFLASDDDEVALTAVDLGVARAFWEGVPAARLLARIRLHRDAHDLVDLAERATGADFDDASWDLSLAGILGASPAALDLVKRRVARHARPASDEGPLPASDPALAALVFASLSGSDEEASPAEGVAEAGPVDDSVQRACARLDDRLARADLRAPVFEACLELAQRGHATPHLLGDLRAALDALGDAPAIVAASAHLYPRGEEDVPNADRRACLLERSDLERTLLRPDLLRRSMPAATTAIVSDATTLVTKGSLLVVALREPRSMRERPRLPPASWFPEDLGSPEAPMALAAALERGATTAPRVRSLLMRSGDAALDAAGKEMLLVQAHPFASSVFAEILATASRERDVIRLVTYFAIAPDPAPAAHALSLCTARELPAALRGWLESNLPRERLAACLEALAPYPNLYEAVKPLLPKVSQPPPGAS